MNQATHTIWQAPKPNSVSLAIAEHALNVAKASGVFPASAIALRNMVDETIANHGINASDEEVRGACLEVGSAWIRWEADQEQPFLPNRTIRSDVVTASAGAALPLGVALENGKTNHPGSPNFAGQVGVFRSPFDSGFWLVDVACVAESAALQWVALPRSDERYSQAIACARSGDPLVASLPVAARNVIALSRISDLLSQARSLWESLPEADREKLNSFHVSRASIGATLPAAATAAQTLAKGAPPEFQELFELMRGSWKEWHLQGPGLRFKHQHHAIAFAAAARIVGYRNAKVLQPPGGSTAEWAVGTIDREGADLLEAIADGRF